MQRDFSIITGAMNSIMQAREWHRTCLEAPEILAADKKISALIEKLQANHPEDADLLDELETSMNQSASAYSTVATLYGIHVALTIMDAAADPVAYSRYAQAEWLAKREGFRK